MAAKIPSLVRRHANEQSAAFYYAKVDTDQIGIVKQLSQAGLYVVDVNVTFSLDPGVRDAVKPSTPSCSIHEISPTQHDQVLDIAGSCFRYSRFHLDPQVPNEIADRIKRKWIQSYITGQRGERLLVAAHGDKPVGFLAVIGSEAAGRRIRTIDLIGVGTGLQRQGVGRALVAFFIDYYRACDYLEVGTQVANIPSIRLYTTFGFEIVRSQYVMHMSVLKRNQSN